MEFTLYYRGPLKANRGAKDKHALRRHFHMQLKRLWQQYPLKAFEQMVGPEKVGQNLWLIRPVHGYRFAPLVAAENHLVAELDILMLRPEPPGAIVTQGGDIDNRIKTLLDALKVPSEPNALPKGEMPSEHEDPLFCLLEDDALIVRLDVRTDRLLEPVTDPSEVILLVRVTTKQIRVLIATLGMA